MRLDKEADAGQIKSVGSISSLDHTSMVILIDLFEETVRWVLYNLNFHR